MAEFIRVIKVGSDSFGDIKGYLDTNPECLFLSSPSGATLKVNLKQEKEKSDGAENIVVRWMNDIKNKASNYVSTTSALNEIEAYCDAVIVAVTSK